MVFQLYLLIQVRYALLLQFDAIGTFDNSCIRYFIHTPYAELFHEERE